MDTHLLLLIFIHGNINNPNVRNLSHFALYSFPVPMKIQHVRCFPSAIRVAQQSIVITGDKEKRSRKKSPKHERVSRSRAHVAASRTLSNYYIFFSLQAYRRSFVFHGRRSRFSFKKKHRVTTTAREREREREEKKRRFSGELKRPRNERLNRNERQQQPLYKGHANARRLKRQLINRMESTKFHRLTAIR